MGLINPFEDCELIDRAPKDGSYFWAVCDDEEIVIRWYNLFNDWTDKYYHVRKPDYWLVNKEVLPEDWQSKEELKALTAKRVTEDKEQTPKLWGSW